MSPFPGSPRLLKGALVTLKKPAYKEVESTIAFQYNPITLTRQLQAKWVEEPGKGQIEAFLLRGAPVETISFEAEIDATDGLEKVEEVASTQGIHPQLAALETLIYPDSNIVKEGLNKAKQGVFEIEYLESSITLLVWGQKRVLPVRLKDFQITEEAYDINLNPIRARVALTIQVLSYDDLRWDTQGAKLFFNHHLAKERMAKRGGIFDNSEAQRATGVPLNGRL